MTSTTRNDPFVGRVNEMTELNSALDSTLQGRGQTVMFAGDPGIGKTRLTEELAESARKQGFAVHWGRCYEDTGAPPYWPWTQILRAFTSSANPDLLTEQMANSAGVASVISDIFPDIKNHFPKLEPAPVVADPESARFRLLDSTSTFFINASRTQPLMLVLDDIHWADAPSLQMLRFFARNIPESRIILAGTYRDTELSRQHPLSETLAELTRERSYRRLQLRGLAEDETRHLLEELGNTAASSQTAAEIASQTQGNPFFVKEIAHELADLPQSGQPIRIPESVREVVGKRLNRLSPEASDLLRNAAIIGLNFDYRLVDRIHPDIDEDAVIGLIEEAASLHLVENSDVPGHYRFAHALIRQTLVDEVTPVSRVRTHAMIAAEIEALRGAAADEHAAELAYHFSEANVGGTSDKVVHYSTIAGEAALAVHAPSDAAAHFKLALGALPKDAPVLQRAKLHHGRAKALAQTLPRSEIQLAVDELVIAFNALLEAGETDSAIEVAHTYLPPVHGPVGMVDVIKRVIPLVEQGSLTHGMLLCNLVQWLSLEDRLQPDAVAEAYETVVEIAERLNDDRLRLAVMSRGFGITFVKSYEQRFQFFTEGTRLATLLNDDHSEFVLKEVFADLLLGYGEFDQAEQNATEALAAARRTRNTFNIATALSVTAGMKLVKADWRGADEILEEGLRIAPDEIRLLMYKVMSLAERGEMDAAEEYARLVNDFLSRSNTHPSGIAWGAMGWFVIKWLGGPDLSDRGLLNRLLDGRVRYGVAYEGGVGARPFVSQLIAATAGLATEDDALLEQVEMDHRHWPPYWRRGPIRSPHQVFGPALHTLGRLDEAASVFEAGLEFCRKLGDRPGIVWLNTDYAEMLLDRNVSGDREKAVILVDEATAVATELGMKPHLEMLAKLSERLGADGAEDGARHPDGLSEREAEVLALIAAGKSNQEIADDLFISRYTVVRHVSNIYSKTGCASRSDATAYAINNGMTG